MPHPGKLFILAIFLLALAAAAFSIWYLRGLSVRALEYYGPEAGQLILRAPTVAAFKLQPAASADASAAQETLSIQGESYAVVAERNISQAKGLVNVRRGLMQDGSYRWDASPRAAIEWQYMLEFSDGQRQASLLFSLDEQRVMLLNQERPLDISPVSAGLEKFLQEQFPVASP